MPISDLLITSYPRSTITQTAMLDRVRGDIGLRGNNLLTDADIIAWANEIQTEIAQRFRWYRTASSIDSVASTKEYALPVGLIAIEEVYYNDRPLMRMNLSDFETNYAYFRQQNIGTPTFYYLRGNSGIGFQATPGDSITNGIFLVYIGTPPVPASGSDFYTVPYGGERAIISGAKLRAAEKDSSGEGARRYDMLLKRHEENMMMLQRAIESVADGEGTVIGSDNTPELGGWRRWMGFDPWNTSAPPS